MALSDMEVFNKYYMGPTIETLAQMVEKFNAASNGAIRLTTEGFEGDFLQESFFAAIHTAQRRVDRYATNEDQAATDLSQLKHSSVKVAGGFGPIRYEPGQLTWLRQPTARGVEVVSRNFAEALLKDQLNTAILALVTAISANTGTKYDASVLSPTGGVSQINLNNSHALFGDHSSWLVAQVMTGSVYHKLIGQNLANTNELFAAANVRVVDILGKAVIVTDAPALYAADSPINFEKVLTLVEGAAMVHDGSDVITNIETSNGKERIETTIQMDYTFGLGLKGYAWDEGNGGKSPSDADLATAAYWDQVATDDKHTAGVILIGDASKS